MGKVFTSAISSCYFFLDNYRAVGIFYMSYPKTLNVKIFPNIRHYQNVEYIYTYIYILENAVAKSQVIFANIFYVNAYLSST